MDIRALCSFCNGSTALTYVLGGPEVLDDLEVLNGLEVLDVDLEVLDNGLEVYDQLLPNGLADPLGMELLEL